MVDDNLFGSDSGGTGPEDGTLTSGRFGETPVEDSGKVPERIGEYRIVGKLGEGGMGVVYEAEQQQPKRRVALKVIRGGQFVDDQRLKMFQREIETLARLKHPNIGAIYESGRTDDGEHFFAMELVRGASLGAFLRDRARALDAEELDLRLRLFRKICDAVHYAHQRGVIHRDLKPSNIVVTEEASTGGSTATGKPMPDVKVLDFGLARITDADVQQATVLTEVGIIRGTLPYMSPEQARGNPDEIDVRSDVYALGVILYEMLSGARPYDTRQSAWMEALRVICEEPPRSLRESWSGVMRLDEDVETIVHKALEKEAGRRYSSAAALSEDVDRYLTSQPILARPPSAAYQLKKLMARNRAMFGAIATVALILVVATVVSTAMFVRAEREADRARTEASKAEEVAGFLKSMLGGVGPSVAQGRDTTLLREILDKTSERVGEEMAEQPEVEATIRSMLGQTYWEMGEYDAAEEQFGQSLELYRGLEGDDGPNVASDLNNIGTVKWAKGELEEAEARFRESLDVRERVLGKESAEYATTLTDLGNILVAQDRFDEAETMLRESLEIKRRTVGEEDSSYAITVNSLGNLLHHMGKLDEAETMYREALRVHREQLGEMHPYTHTDMANLAQLLEKKGEFEAAGALHHESLELQRKVLGEEHPRVAEVLSNLGSFYKRTGDYDEAERALRQALEMQRRLLGEENDAVARTLTSLAVALDDRGDKEEAEVLYRESLELKRKVFGPRSGDVASGLNNMASVYQHREEYDKAEAMYLEALDIYVELYGERHDSPLLVRNNIARLYRDQDDFDRAAAAFEEVIALRKEVLGEDHWQVGISLFDLARVRKEQERLDEAEALMRESLDLVLQTFDDSHFGAAVTRVGYATVLDALGKVAEAEEQYRIGLETYRVTRGDADRRTLRVLGALGRVVALQDRLGEAEVFFEEVFAARDNLKWRDLGAVLRDRGVARTRAGRWQDAEADLLESHRIFLDKRGEDDSRTKQSVASLVALYEAWDEAEPAAGKAGAAATWRAKPGGS